jgi:hypothetical protein
MTSNEMPLKPCPFCGEQPKITEGETTEYGVVRIVSCENNWCQIQPIADCLSLEMSIEKWNTRATPDKVMIDKKALEGLVKALEWYNDRDGSISRRPAKKALEQWRKE